MRDGVQVKYLSTTSLLQADGLENLRAAIALDGRDAHLGHDLDHAFDGGLDVFLDGGLVVDLGQQALPDHVVERLKGQVRIDGAATVADEQREMMHLARFAGFEHQARPACACPRESNDDAGRPPPAAPGIGAMLARQRRGRTESGCWRPTRPRRWRSGKRSSSAPCQRRLRRRPTLNRIGSVTDLKPAWSTCRSLSNSSLVRIGCFSLISRQLSGLGLSRLRSRADGRFRRGDDFLADADQSAGW